MLLDALRMNKKVVALIVVFMLLLVGYVSYILVDRSSKISITIVAVPSDAKIMIGDIAVGTGEQFIKEGTYKVVASKEGFANFSTSIDITKDGQKIIIPLSAVSVEAKKWAKDHLKDYLELEGVAGQNAQAEGKIFRDKNPIVDKLPYKNFLYSIGYRDDPSDPSGSSIILEIKARDGYRQAAIYQIFQLGFDPTMYKINFSDYTNPFTL